MNWACDNSHKPIDSVPVLSVSRKYTILAIKLVFLQNVPKQFRLYGPISVVLANINISVGTIKKIINIFLFNLIDWLMYLS